MFECCLPDYMVDTACWWGCGKGIRKVNYDALVD